MTVSEYIFDFLQKKGVTTVYMVSGSSAMWLTDALKRNEKLKPVCTQHEQVAAMAADAYGRTAGGVPGVCLVTIGPGATNAITGVAGAYVDSSPMFVLSGQANSRMLAYEIETCIRQKGTQSLNLEPLVSSITKYFAAVMKPEDIRYHMERAYYEAVNGRRGPVWIDVPVDIQNRQTPEEMEGFVPDDVDSEKVQHIDEVVGLLSESKKPLLMLGYGVLSSGATEKVLEFARKYRIPVVTSRGGIGCISSDDELFVGRPGSYGDRASHFAIQECDFILILGSRLSVSTIGYYPDRFAKMATKVMVDIDEKELDKDDVPVDIKINSDINTFMDRLLTAIDEKKDASFQSHEEWIEHCKNNKEKYPVVQEDYKAEDGLNSYVFTDALSKLVPKNASIVVDTGSVCNIVSQSWGLKRGQKYTISGGLSCMGFWASSIGAAANSNLVVALSGDGATHMNVQDFATLKYYNLPIKLFIYNNRGYMLIRHNQHNYMNDRFLGVGPDSGVPAIDYSKVAAAYDLPCIRIQDGDNLDEKIRETLEIDGPVICEVMVQEFGIIAPRIASKVMPDGSLKAAEFDDLWPFLDEENVDE